MRASLQRNWRSLFIALALVFDLVSIVMSAFVAYFIRQMTIGLTKYPVEVFVNYTLFFGVVMIFLGLLNGLYRATYHAYTPLQFFLAARAYALSVLLIFSSLYLLTLDSFPRRFTILFLLITPASFTLGRLLLYRLNAFMRERGFGVYRVLLVGYNQTSSQIQERFQGFPEFGYEICGIVGKEKRRKPSQAGAIPLYPYFHLDDLPSVIREESINRVFVASTELVSNGYSSVLSVCQKENVKLKVLSSDSDHLLRRARVYDLAGITLFAPARRKVEFFRKVLKRAADIFGAVFFLSLLSPVFLLTAIAIYIESGRPIFFKQKRSSLKNGPQFYFYKFRSMVKNADEMKESLHRLNESDGALFKMKNDPRMTTVGRLIRKFSIDELPQLFNVVNGDMSLVGPRPLPISDYENVKENDEYWESIKDRAKAKPGMTGLWQISGRSNIGFREMVLLDLYYIENQSLLFDLEILFATIPVVLFGKGAY